jgi:hypothetical protein
MSAGQNRKRWCHSNLRRARRKKSQNMSARRGSIRDLQPVTHSQPAETFGAERYRVAVAFKCRSAKSRKAFQSAGTAMWPPL